MKRVKHYYLLIISAVICFSGFEIAAQELEVSPGTLSFTANPGSSQTQLITIRNKGGREQSFIFNLNDWLTDENGEVRYFSPGTTARSCAEWITVSPSLVTLQPNESATVNVTMLVPSDDMSTKWAVLFVQSAVEQTGPRAVDKEMALGVQLALRIAITIYQSPASNTLFKGTIDGLTEKTGEENARIFASRVINLGDKILNCKVYYIISNVETAEEIMSTPFEFSLLPDNSKKVEFLLNESLEPGSYTIAAILDYGHQDELEGIQMDFEVK